jgi:hypothetical protein
MNDRGLRSVSVVVRGDERLAAHDERNDHECADDEPEAPWVQFSDDLLGSRGARGEVAEPHARPTNADADVRKMASGQLTGLE